jgi:hypothetical protein
MSRRLQHPPDPIARATSEAKKAALRGWHLVRGEVLGFQPRAARAIAGLLPYGLGPALADGAPEAVVARVDVEETYTIMGGRRPELERFERGRDFYVGDGSGHALVRIEDESGRLQERVELHLDSAFRTHRLPRTAARPDRTAYLRSLRVGQTVYLMGRVRLEQDASGLGAGAGAYREAPVIAVFTGDASPLHLYDEPAFQQVAAWRALPWYRKLSVLVRNR